MSSNLILPGSQTFSFPSNPEILYEHQKLVWQHLITHNPRYTYLAWARRLGKDYIGWLYCIYRMMFTGQPGTALYIFPTADMGRRVLFNNKDLNGKSMLSYIPGFDQYGRGKHNHDLVRNVNNADLQITVKHVPTGEDSFIKIRQADPDTLLGANYKMFLISEFCVPDFNPDVLPYSVVPTMRNNPECQTLILTTWRGENHATKTFDLWNERNDGKLYFCDLRTILDGYKADGSPVTSMEALQEEVRAGNIKLSTFKQEFLMDRTAANESAYYSEQLDALTVAERISPRITHDPMLPVYTAWDIGGFGKTPGERTAIWFLQYNKYTRQTSYIDYMEAKQLSLNSTITKVIQRCSEMHYRHACAFLPHDAKQTESNGLQRLNHFKAANMVHYILPKTGSVQADIEQVRTALHGVQINSRLCEDGLRALKAYGAKELKGRDNLGDVTYGKADHNWASHASDAFRYSILAAKYFDRYDRSVAEFERQNKPAERNYRYI